MNRNAIRPTRQIKAAFKVTLNEMNCSQRRDDEISCIYEFV